MKQVSIFAALLLITGATGCSSNEQTPTAESANETQRAAGKAEAPSSANSATAQAPTDESAAGNVASPVATSAGPALTDYDGKEPFEKVNGVAFLDHPLVRAEVAKVVVDPAIRKWVLEAGTNPWSPMFLKAGQLVAIGCQQHACDKRSWAVVIDVKTQVARVCFEVDDRSRWYSASGVQPQDGDCPSDVDDFDA